MSLNIKPIVNYPRVARAGERYLLSIDVRLEDGTTWDYPEEEYVISFLLDTRPYFSIQPILDDDSENEPLVILHRFGGTYGPARYLLTATSEATGPGYIGVTLVNGWGVPLARLDLECEVQSEIVEQGEVVQIGIGRRENAPSRQKFVKQRNKDVNLENDGEITSKVASVDTKVLHVESLFALCGWRSEGLASIGSSSGTVTAVYSETQVKYSLIVHGDKVGEVRLLLSGEAGSTDAGRYLFDYEILPTDELEIWFNLPGHARKVSAFHRPETLLYWANQLKSGNLFRTQWYRMVPLDSWGLYYQQVAALEEMEAKLTSGATQVLLEIPTGSGQTHTILHSIHRFLRFAGAQRALYVSERAAHKQYLLDKLRDFTLVEGGAWFKDLYAIQDMADGIPDPNARICIATFAELSTSLVREIMPFGRPIERPVYSPALPIESFDVIYFEDATYESYQHWRPVLDYFDAILIAATDLPDRQLREEFGYPPETFVNSVAQPDSENISQQATQISNEVQEEPRADPIRVYYSYINEDKLLVGDFQKAMQRLKQQGLVQELLKHHYPARGYEAGAHVTCLEQAGLIIGLVSAAYLQQGEEELYVKTELQYLQQRLQAGHDDVLLVQIRPIMAGQRAFIQEEKLLPHEKLSVADYYGDEREQILQGVVDEIARNVKHLQSERFEAQRIVNRFETVLQRLSAKQRSRTNGSKPLREHIADVREALKEAKLSPGDVWLAYWQLDPSRVHGAHEQRGPSDIVSLMVYAGKQDDVDAVLEPFKSQVQHRFDVWLTLAQKNEDTLSNRRQRRWLNMMRDCIAMNVQMELEDFNREPFQSSGGLEMAIKMFESRVQLEQLVRELNEELVKF